MFGRRTRNVACLFYIAVLVFFAVMVARNPVAFQKSVAIVEDASVAMNDEPSALDVKRVINDIPFAEHPQDVADVLPSKKFQRTILGGDGNCSNLAFGLAYDLSRRDVEFQIVHIIPRREFMSGQGHTVLRTRYRIDDVEQVGLVDVYEGGVPTCGTQRLDLHHLSDVNLTSVKIENLSPAKDKESPYYDEMLKRSTIGVLTASDVARYFSFIEAIYVPLGHDKIEKYAYDGIAILLGQYPAIRVKSIDQTFAGCHGERWFFLVALWFFRAAIFVLPAMLLSLAVTRFRSATPAHVHA